MFLFMLPLVLSLNSIYFVELTENIAELCKEILVYGECIIFKETQYFY